MTTEVMLFVTNISSTTRQIDLYENEVVALNWRFTDLLTLSVTGTYSKQFRVPNTPNNNEIFGSIFNPNSTGIVFNFSTKCRAELKVSTIPIVVGFIQLRQVVTRLGDIHEYEIVFYSETPDLSSALGQYKIADINELSNLDHELNFDNIVDGVGSDVIYALTDRGQKWSEVGEVNSRPILNVDQPIYGNEMTPCIKGKWIFDKIIEEAGFTWEGTELADELDRYWFPCANQKYIAFQNDPSAYLFKVGLDSNQTVSDADTYQPITSFVEDYDNNNDFASDVYTIPFTGWFTFRVWFSIEVDPVSIGINSQFSVRLRETTNGNTIWSSDSQTVTPTYPQRNFVFTLPDRFFGQGQTIQLEWQRAGGDWTILGSATNDPNAGTGWELVSCSLPVAGENVSMVKNVPDMLQIDFIKSIIDMHNCVVIPDRETPRKLLIQPIVDYIAAGSVKDWTNKLDLNKDMVLMPTTEFQASNLEFTYLEGPDVGSQLYKAENRIYGNYEIDGYQVAFDQVNDFAKGDFKLELKFQSIPAIDIAGTSIPIQKFVNADGEFQTPLPCLLYNAGTADVALFNDDTLLGEIATVNILSNYDQVFPSTLFQDDLNWAPEQDLYAHTIVPLDNLFNRFYRTYLNQIYSQDARLLDAYFNLSVTDIFNFRFNDRIFVKECYWRILEIYDYDFGGSSSIKVRLIKEVSVSPICYESIPSGVTAGGIVEWQDANGDPTTPSDKCCAIYGWFYNSVTDECSTIAGVTIERKRLQTQSNTNRGTLFNAETSVTRATFSEISEETTQSLLLGTNLQVEDGNSISVIAGDSIQILGEQRGAAVFGKNALVQYPGIHIGGGWYEDDRDLIIGSQQIGMFTMAAGGDFPSNNSQIMMTIDGIKDKHVNTPDECMWTCELSLSVVQHSAGSITGVGHGLFLFDLYKSGGTTNAGTVTTVHQSSSHGNYSVMLDDTTDPNECRISIKSSGGSYPYNGIRIVSTLKYTQIRINS